MSEYHSLVVGTAYFGLSRVRFYVMIELRQVSDSYVEYQISWGVILSTGC